MNILFSHKNFPAQFRHLAAFLAKNKDNNVIYLTNRNDSCRISDVNKIYYSTHRDISPENHPYLRYFEESILHGQGALRAAMKLRAEGFIPDVIIGHSWGQSMFLKDIYPESIYIAHIEWFYNSTNSDVDFVQEADIDLKARTRIRNSHLLVDLYSCDKAITPTKWQLAQIPKEFHNKISVIHEGIDTSYFASDENAVFKVNNRELTKEDEVITYATRGMEPYRGFPQFMEAVSIIQKRRPNCHIIIAGADRVCYGKTLKDTTYKQLMLQKYKYDLDRLHFVGVMPYNDYKKLLQISSVHVYLTYPFVLSWSMLEAMSSGCILLASNTPPVTEVIKEGENGLLFDFFSTKELVDRIDEVLSNKDNYNHLRINARQTIFDHYDLNNSLEQQLKLINGLKPQKLLTDFKSKL